MKQFLLASTAVVALSAPSLGADLAARFPVKAPVVAAPPYSWTGCYVGGHAGVGWGRKEYSDNTFGDIGGSIPFDVGAGFVAGGQVGCDYQFASNWVVGIAGDFSWANIEGQTDDPFFAGKFGNPLPLYAKTNFLGTVTGRVGYAWDHYLLYVKGGAAWAHDKYAISNLAFFNGFVCGIACNVTGSETRTGWTAGGGFEWAFAQNWSAFVEFDYYGFGTKAVSFSDPNFPFIGSSTFDVKQNIAVAKLGINYRFNFSR